jgi:hypothetical protein
MQPPDYTAFALMRSELQRDYTPANAQERLLVDEVAHCWRRLEQARNREELFFDLQKTSTAIRGGGEVRMWGDEPHKAYDQVMRAIRNAGADFDRAIRRIEQVRNRRLARERLDRKEEERAVKQAAKPRPKTPVLKPIPNIAPVHIEMPAYAASS